MPTVYFPFGRAAVGDEVTRGERVAVEFSWVGVDDGDEVSRRGWATLTEAGQVEGRIFFHSGDDSGFWAVPA
jgi:hypothetical protein